MKITQQQIEILDTLMVERILQKVADFLMVEKPRQMEQLADPAGFVKVHYALAREHGRKTERAIVEFILDALSNKT